MLSVSTPNEALAKANQEDIQKTLDRFTSGWNDHDVKIFSTVFAEDADFTNVMGVSRHGRAAIEELHEPGFNGIWAYSTLAITKSNTRFIKPDVAAVDAWWILDGLKDPEGKDRPPRNGLLNFIMTKQDDVWMITVMHNMDLPGSKSQNC